MLEDGTRRRVDSPQGVVDLYAADRDRLARLSGELLGYLDD